MRPRHRGVPQSPQATVEEPNDLAEAIGQLGAEIAASRAQASEGSVPSPIAFHVIVEGVSRRKHPIVRDEIYRIAAEALRNAFHHSHATKIAVELHYDLRQFRMRVRDNGRGIDQEILAAGGREGHFGLRGMRERAGRCGEVRAELAADRLAAETFVMRWGNRLGYALPAPAGIAGSERTSARRSWRRRRRNFRKSTRASRTAPCAGRDKIGLRVGKVVNKYKVGKHFALTIEENGFNYQRLEKQIAAEAALDGIYVIRTSVAKKQMTSAEAVRSYKALAEVGGRLCPSIRLATRTGLFGHAVCISYPPSRSLRRAPLMLACC